MMENDRLTLSPILVKDLRSVFRGDDAHKTYLSMIGREVLVVRQRNDRAAFCFLGITFSSLESGVAVLSQDTFRPSKRCAIRHYRLRRFRRSLSRNIFNSEPDNHRVT